MSFVMASGEFVAYVVCQMLTLYVIVAYGKLFLLETQRGGSSDFINKTYYFIQNPVQLLAVKNQTENILFT